jgi:hypothetical protein
MITSYYFCPVFQAFETTHTVAASAARPTTHPRILFPSFILFVFVIRDYDYPLAFFCPVFQAFEATQIVAKRTARDIATPPAVDKNFLPSAIVFVLFVFVFSD